MNDLKIPKSFMVFGLTIPTVWRGDMGTNVGEWTSHPPVIKLSTTLLDKHMPPARVHQTYCHEVVHSWLSSLGRKEMSENEELVEQLGNCLHQFITTRKY